MTWQEFVSEVERQMAEKGIPKDAEVFYIDTHMPDDRMEVWYSPNQNEIMIS